MGEASSTHLCTAAQYAAPLRPASCLTAIAPTQNGFCRGGARHGQALPCGCYFSRSRRSAISASNNLTRRAITGISSSSQELSPRRKSAAGFLNQTIRCEAIHCRARRTWPPQRTELADSQGRPRRQTGARRRRWASRTGIDASAPLRKPSFKHLPSNT
jgi:hypothetical protein